MTRKRTDSLIAADVVQLLGTHGQAGEVLAQVVDGRVRLDGQVPSAAVAAELRQRISALPGVVQVDDQLRIVLPSLQPSASVGGPRERRLASRRRG